MTTASTASLGFPVVPAFEKDGDTHRRKLAAAVNLALAGKMNCTLDVTLTSSASSTTMTDSRIGYYSAILPMPLTAHADSELGSGNFYIPQSTIKKGSAVIQHTNNSQSDRTFRFVILG